MVRKMKNLENETQTLYDLESGEKSEWREKWDTKNVCRNMTWDNEKCANWEKHTVELEFGEKTEKRGKWDTNTVSQVIW